MGLLDEVDLRIAEDGAAAQRLMKSTSRSGEGDDAFLETACCADVEPQPIRWLWPERIALGKLTVLAGDPGLGKSMVTLVLAAHVTRGTLWPIDRAECPQGTVLLISGEDDIADTIRPRLDVAGADVTHVHALKTIRQPDPETGRPADPTPETPQKPPVAVTRPSTPRRPLPSIPTN